MTNIADNERGNQGRGGKHGLAYWKALVQYARIDDGEPVLGEFRKLRGMNITHLLNEIVRVKAEIKRTSTTSLEQMEELCELLHQYSKEISSFPGGIALSD
jgi:hypothetical protein